MARDQHTSRPIAFCCRFKLEKICFIHSQAFIDGEEVAAECGEGEGEKLALVHTHADGGVARFVPSV